jgi:hypothetical protein
LKTNIPAKIRTKPIIVLQEITSCSKNLDSIAILTNTSPWAIGEI